MAPPEVNEDFVDVAVLGRDALIANKLAAGRDKDLLDVRLLQRKPNE